MSITEYIKNSPIMGIAHHRIILNDDGIPVDYEFIEINSTFEKLTGLKRENIIGKGVLQAIPGIERSGFDWIAYYGEIALKGMEKSFEQFSEPLGRWYRVHAYSTERMFFTTMFIDITENKKQAEELEGFFNVNLDLLCIADTDGHFIKTNKVWSEILGYSTDDLNKRKFLEFVHPDDMKATLDAMSKLGRGEEVLNFINRYRCKDGSYRFIEWRSHPKDNLIYAAARDVTKHIKDVEVIKSREEETEAILKSMDEMLLVLDNDLIFKRLHFPDPKMLLMPQEKLLGKSFDEINFPEPAYSKIRDALSMSLGDGRSRSIQYCLKMPHGKAWFEARISVIQGHEGIVRGLTCIIQNITDHILKEHEILSQKKQIEQFFNQSLHGFFISMLDEPVKWDENTDKEKMMEYVLDHQRMTRVNQAMLDQYGAKEEDFIGITIRELFKHDLDHAREIWRGLFDKGKWHVETREQKMDGTPIIIDGDYICLYDEEGRITGHFGVQVEITEQKKMQKALRDSKERFNTLLSNTPAVIYSYNILKDRTARINYVNENIKQVLGYEPEDFINNFDYFKECIHPEDEQKVFDALSELMEKGYVSFREYRFKDKNGRYRWLHDEQNLITNEDGSMEVIGAWWDITRRKEMEDALIINQKRLSQAQTFARAGHWEYDIKSSRLYWSPECEALFGLEEGSFGGTFEDFLNLVHPEDRDYVIQQNAPITEVRKGVPLEYDHRIITREGKVLWVRETAGITWDQENNPIQVSGFVLDITDRKAVEEEIKIARKQYQSLVDNIPGITYRCIQDKDWTMLFMSDAVEELSGYSAKDFINNAERTYESIIHPDDRDYVSRNINSAVSNRQEWNIEYQLKHRNGDVLWVQERGRGIPDEEGNIAYLDGFILNISDRKKAEESLAEERVLLSSILEAAPIGIWLVDENQNPILVNKKFQQDTGFGTHSISMIPEEIAQCKKTDDDAIAMDSPQSYEEKVTFKDKTKHILHTIKTPLYNTDSTLKGVLGIGIDITNAKKSEEELRNAKEQAEKASKAKSQFLANMSHEIRTPLNGVIGFTDLLKATPLSPAQQQYVDNANVSAHTLLGIINDILDFSKIEAGMLELEIIRTDMIQLFENSVDIIKYSAGKKNLEVLLNVDIDMPRFAMVDPVRLKQILANLLGNAVKFTKTGEVELKVRYSSLESRKGKFSISVRDTGIGISDAQKEKLFKAFSQADSSTTRRFGGTGLGLIISDMITRRMGSKIKFDSIQGKGSTFFFDLTTDTEPGEAHSHVDISHIKTCLIIDDNTNNQMILEHMLKAWSIQCEICDNAYDAMKALENSGIFDIIICDYNMPYIDGLETIRMIRSKLSLSPEKQPVILLHSSFDDAELHKQCNALGVRFCITKPVKQEQLFACLATLHEPHSNQVQASGYQDTEAVIEKSSLTLLVVEDVPMNMLLIKTLLSNILPEANIIEAENGIIALRKYRETNPDIILMDIQMPEMDGIDATRSIREMEEDSGEHIPIIALTAGALKKEMDRCLEAGMDDFLTKPISPDKLKTILEKHYGEAEEKSFQPSEILFDRDLMIEHCGRETALEIIDIIKSEIPRQIESIRLSIKSNDRKSLKLQSHKLKGASLNGYMPRMASIASSIEEMALNEDNRALLEKKLMELSKAWDEARIELEKS